MDDLSKNLNISNVGCVIGDKIINHLAYADDLCLISISTTGMQKLLNICSEYGVTHDIKYNSLKSCTLHFLPKYMHGIVVNFNIDNGDIPVVNETKYLGTYISNRNPDVDLNRQLCKFYGKINVLIRTFSSCTYNTKISLFKSYCTNMYCSPLWFGCTKTAKNKLHIAYNNGLRRFLGTPYHSSASEMFVCLNILSFGELLRKNIYNFKSRILCSSNRILTNVVQKAFYVSPIWGWWSTVLHGH